MAAMISYSCGDDKNGTIGLAEAAAVAKAEIFTAEIIKEGPSEDIQWLTNNADPLYASPAAKKGGTFRSAIKSFPLTFRTIGPDSNTEFRSAILGNQLSLTGLHPNTMNIIPELATHWAFGKDKKTMYFKLNPSARWSDGQPVTAHWGIPDPAAAMGGDAERRLAFSEAYRRLDNRISLFALLRKFRRSFKALNFCL